MIFLIDIYRDASFMEGSKLDDNVLLEKLQGLNIPATVKRQKQGKVVKAKKTTKKQPKQGIDWSNNMAKRSQKKLDYRDNNPSRDKK